MEGKINFSKLIHPISENVFFNEYWEKKPLYIKRDDNNYYDFVSDLSEINDYLNRNDLSFPSIRLVKDGVDIPADLYSRDVNHGSFQFRNLIYNDSIFDYFNGGASILLLNPLWGLSKMGKLFKSLEAYFKFPFISNVFISPKSEQAFLRHFDNQDLFIIQLYGKKIWKIYDSPIKNPTNELPIAFGKIPMPDNILQEIEINAGDLIYLPRGFAHEVHTIDSISVHVTLSLLPPKWFDIFDSVKDVSIQLPEFRESYYNSLVPDNRFKTLFSNLIDKISYNDIEEIVFEKLIQTQILDNENRFFDILEIEKEEINTLVFERRKNILYRIDISKDQIVVFFYKKKLNFPIHARRQIEYIINNDSFRLSDLTIDLEVESTIIMIQILLKYGFLKIKTL